MEDERKSYHRDKRLTVTARSIMTWILGDPSEVINPAVIAQENGLTVKYVRTLLSSLARCGYLNAPRQLPGKRGRFEWTPYTLKPQPVKTAVVNAPQSSTSSMVTSPQPAVSAMVQAPIEPETPYTSTVSMVSAPQPTTTAMVEGSIRAENPPVTIAHENGHGVTRSRKEESLNINTAGSDKEKDKKPLSPPAAGDSQVKSKTLSRERNPLFDAITVHIFGIALDKKAAIAAAAGRIGKMLKNFPAELDSLTPERIAQFARWWSANKNGISKPLDAGKLATHWTDFERQCPVKPDVQSAENTARLEENRRYLEQEQLKQRAFMLGETS